MTTEQLLKELEAEIEKQSDQIMNDTGHLSDSAFYEIAGFSDGYKAGAYFLLPLIKKLLDQRDAYPESDYPKIMSDAGIAHDNTELIKILRGEK